MPGEKPGDYSKVLRDVNLLLAFLSFCFPVWFVSVQHICEFVEVLRLARGFVWQM